MFALLLATITACNQDSGSRELPELPPLPPLLAERASTAGPERPIRELIVALTGSVRGEVEVCGCPTTPYGGFERRGVLYGQLRSHGVPTFAVDAGEMLVKGLTARDEVDRRLRAEAVLDLAAAAGLDAWAASPLDLPPGGPAVLQEHGALSANWVPEGGAPLPPTRVVEHEGVRLGVIGLSDVPGPDDPDGAVRAVAAAMTEPVDLWVALSNASEAVNRAVAEGVPGLGAVLATQGDSHDEPLATHGAPIIEVAARGRYVSVLHLTLGTDSRPVELVNRGVWKDVALARGRLASAGEGAAVVRAELERDAARLPGLTTGRNVAFVESVPLDAGYAPGDRGSGVSARLEGFRQSVLSSAAAASARPAPEGGYATGSSCAGCHSDRMASWGFDAHAHAMASLIQRDAQANPECVACHSTGFGRPGGFAELKPERVEAFRDVQCEACHGPMAGHDGRGGKRSAPVTEATCRTCHDEANSPKFDYGAYRSQLSCVRVSGQSEPDR